MKKLIYFSTFIIVFLFTFSALSTNIKAKPDSIQNLLNQSKALVVGDEDGGTYIKTWMGPYSCQPDPETLVYCKDCTEGGTKRCTQTCPAC